MTLAISRDKLVGALIAAGLALAPLVGASVAIGMYVGDLNQSVENVNDRLARIEEDNKNRSSNTFRLTALENATNRLEVETRRLNDVQGSRTASVARIPDLERTSLAVADRLAGVAEVLAKFSERMEIMGKVQERIENRLDNIQEQMQRDRAKEEQKSRGSRERGAGFRWFTEQEQF